MSIHHGSDIDVPFDVTLSFFGPRRPRVFFYTSNVNKFLQARHVFARYGLVLEHFHHHTSPYQEDYSDGTDALLARAIQQITAMVGRGALFFVEDTSLRIEGLSHGDEDVPGLGVKEWHESTNFEKLDCALREAGDDRMATVKSAIALHLPGRVPPVYFYGETSGVVAPAKPRFASSAIHPWLDPLTFDGWFIPDGSKKCLAEMTSDESLRYHFRARALRLLLDRLGEYTATLNMQPTAYRVRRSHTRSNQASLFPDPAVRFLIVGPRAAGKTTFGEYAAATSGAEHFEASMVVRSFRREYGGDEYNLSDFAARLHERLGDDIVARTLIENLELAAASNVAVTGLRKLAELSCFDSAGLSYRLVYIHATARTRFERYVTRAREDASMSYEEFAVQDSEEISFLRIAALCADAVITNEYDMKTFLAQIAFVTEGMSGTRPQGIRAGRDGLWRFAQSLRWRALCLLASCGQALSIDEIAEAFRRQGRAAHSRSIDRAIRRETSWFGVTNQADGGTLFELLPLGTDVYRVIRAKLTSRQRER